jgi:hypothetical protein
MMADAEKAGFPVTNSAMQEFVAGILDIKS